MLHPTHLKSPLFQKSITFPKLIVRFLARKIKYLKILFQQEISKIKMSFGRQNSNF